MIPISLHCQIVHAVAIFFLFFSHIRGAATDAEYAALLQVCQTISAHSAWPVNGTDGDSIDETFGPRHQPSTNKYDWHRGLDFDSNNGTTKEIVAVYDGKFYRYSYLSNASGYTLTLEHSLPNQISYNGINLTKFYTYYLHLDDTAKPQWLIDAIADNDNNSKRTVTAGTVVATMGDSGTSGGENYDVHLHFEVRMGSVSSLEYQLDNPQSTQWGFDPHMHPLLLYPEVNTIITIEELTRATPLQSGVYLITLDNDDYPVLNRVEVRIRNALAADAVVKSHVLDFNRRIGYDASSTTALDTRDLSKPHMNPLLFTDQQTNYQTQLIIPADFLADVFLPGHYLEILAQDLWQNDTVQSWSAPTALETWRHQWYGSIANSGNAANLANPSGDGLSNLLKYACNLDPSMDDRTVLQPGNGTKGLPVQSVVEDNGPRLQVEFLRRTAASHPDIIYQIQYLDAASVWQPGSGSETVVPIDALWERVIWKEDPSLAPGQARILRLRITGE